MKLKKVSSMILAVTLACTMTVTPVLADEVSDLKQKKQETQNQVSNLQTQLNSLMTKISDLENDLIETGEEISQTEEDLKTAQEEQEQQYAAMKLRIKYMYEEGTGTATVEKVLTSGDISSVLTQAEYSQQVHSYDRDKLEEYVATVQKVEDLKTTLETKMADLQETQTEYDAQKDELNTTITEKSSEIANLDVKIDEAVKKAAEEEAKRKAAEEAAKKQEEQRKDQNSQGGNSSSGDSFGSGTGQPEQPAQPVPPAQKPVNNPITVIKRIMKMGALELVLPAGKGISANEIDKSTLVSGRQLQQGMKMPDGITAENGYSSGILFQQYLMNHLGNYSEPSSAGLAYQMEYIFAGKDNDVDNLKSVATKLLFIREGVNFACLMADNVKRSEAQALATLIASSFLIPPAAAVIESALLLCWAFAESVLDVRELFCGGKIPLVKTAAEWQISLENLPNLMQGLDSMRRNDENGMSYEDYLQVLVLSVNKSKKVMRSMDMIENTIRSNGREHFYMDSCIVALEAFADVKANKKKEFQVIRQYCY